MNEVFAKFVSLLNTSQPILDWIWEHSQHVKGHGFSAVLEPQECPDIINYRYNYWFYECRKENNIQFYAPAPPRYEPPMNKRHQLHNKIFEVFIDKENNYRIRFNGFYRPSICSLICITLMYAVESTKSSGNDKVVEELLESVHDHIIS